MEFFGTPFFVRMTLTRAPSGQGYSRKRFIKLRSVQPEGFTKRKQSSPVRTAEEAEWLLFLFLLFLLLFIIFLTFAETISINHEAF